MRDRRRERENVRGLKRREGGKRWKVEQWGKLLLLSVSSIFTDCLTFLPSLLDLQAYVPSGKRSKNFLALGALSNM